MKITDLQEQVRKICKTPEGEKFIPVIRDILKTFGVEKVRFLKPCDRINFKNQIDKL